MLMTLVDYITRKLYYEKDCNCYVVQHLCDHLYKRPLFALQPSVCLSVTRQPLTRERTPLLAGRSFMSRVNWCLSFEWKRQIESQNGVQHLDKNDIWKEAYWNLKLGGRLKHVNDVEWHCNTESRVQGPKQGRLTPPLWMGDQPPYLT